MGRSRRRRWLVVPFVGLVVAPGCAGDDAGQDATSPTTIGDSTASNDTAADTTTDAATTDTDESETVETDDGTTSAVDDGTAESDDPIYDVGTAVDIPRTECVACEIDLMTTQSNAFVTTAGTPLFVTAQLGSDLVFGLGEAGAGRLAVSGDGNVIYREGTCPLWEWLGATGTQTPRVLCIGADWPCRGETEAPNPLEINHLHLYPGQLDYGGLTLPAPYDGDASALHLDYDVVVYIAVNDFETGTWDYDPADVDTLESFVRDEGGGLYLVGEYWGAMSTEHLTSLNGIAAPYDVQFEQLSLAWGPASATVELECFPEPAG